MAKARALPMWQVLLMLFGLMTATAMLTAAVILPYAGSDHHDAAPALPLQLINEARANSQSHLNALAQQLGEVQARMMRLDALSDRLAQLAGVRDREPESEAPPGRGGPMVHEYNMDYAQLGEQLDLLVHELDKRGERLDLLEAMLLQQNLKKNTLPSMSPVDVGYKSSSFGWRVDPFTGKMAMHEGLDFVAETGTPIYAAADGIVAQAERTPDYGNLVKIDHGTGLETRYAHASRLHVKAGERVVKGQLIAEVGNTGRSTGAHLHFEVRLNGVPLDPRKYLPHRTS